MFLALDFFRGGPPEFLDLHYKDGPYCDHVAKFRGDRPRELDFVATEKKTSAAKQGLPVLTYGRPNKDVYSYS